MNESFKNQYLDKDEEILLFDRESYSKNLKDFIFIIVGVMFIMPTVIFILSIFLLFIYLIFINFNLIFLVIAYSIIFFLFFKFLLWILSFLAVSTLIITNKRLIFEYYTENYPSYYFADFEDFVEFKFLNYKNSKLDRYEMKTKFYSYFFDIKDFKFGKFFLRKGKIALSKPAATLIAKQLKEKVPNCEINI